METPSRSAPLWKRLLRHTAVATVQLLLLLGAARVVEDYRGERAWARYKRDLADQGITLQTLLARVVPDGENFAKNPIFDPKDPIDLKDRDAKAALIRRLQLRPKEDDAPLPSSVPWRLQQKLSQDDWAHYFGTPRLRDYLKLYQPELREISLAASRPYALFQADYTEGTEIETAHLGLLFNFGTLYQLRSIVSLSEGIPDKAADDVITLLQLAKHSENPPLLIASLVEVSLLNLAMQPLWEGMERHQWPESVLITLQSYLQEFDLIADWPRIVRGEQLLGINTTEQLAAKRYQGRSGDRSASASTSGAVIPADYQPASFTRSLVDLTPSGWIYQNAIASRSYYETLLLLPVNLINHTVAPQTADEIERRAAQIHSRHPYRFLAPSFLPPFAGTLEKVAHAQATIHQATLACALERYWLRHRSYPVSLRSLVPRYCKRIPHDPITGGPMKYSLTEDGGYQIYSVGWNQIDDGGRVAIKATNQIRHDSRDGDWVWRISGGATPTTFENGGLVQTKESLIK